VIGLIVLGLAFLFFLVVAYFAAQTWHVGHVVAMTFLFLFTLLTLYMTATLFRTNKEFHPKYTAATEKLKTAEARSKELAYGSGGTELIPTGTVSGERTLAKIESISRGRIWRNVFAMPGNGPTIPLNMSRWNNDGCLRVGNEDEFSGDAIEPVADEDVSEPVEGEEAVAAAPASSHGLTVGKFVYAFKDFPIARMTAEQKAHYFGMLADGEFANQDTKGMCRVPIAYLGKFLVVDANPNAVQVQLQGQPDPGQRAQLNNQGPWVLYERLPMDVANLFGPDADAAKVSQLLPLKRFVDSGLPIPQGAYNNMISDYANDGNSPPGRVDPFRTRVEVKFLREWSQVVDLQVEGALPAADQPFNVEGHAQVTNLIQGKPTEFAAGDTAVFDGVTAQSLIRQGVAEPVGEPTYARQLRMFEYSIDDYQKRFDDVAVQITDVNKSVAALTDSLQRLQLQIDKHQEELQQLQQDEEGFEAEKVELEKYRQELEMRYQMLQGEVNALTGGGYVATPDVAG